MTPLTQDEDRFESFLAEFDKGIAKLGGAAVAWLRRLLPSSDVMVYDNYNFLVAGFSPNDRPSDAVLSIAMSARGVNLCFLQGATLADPAGVLRGSGRQARNVRLTTLGDFERPEIAALIKTSLDHARVRFDPHRRGSFYVKSVSSKKRPRRLRTATR